MAHLYLMTRGIKHDVERMINELAGKYLPFKWRKEAGAPLEDCQVQLAVRPIQLWEVVYPEESQDIVLNTIFAGNNGDTQHKKHKPFVYALRKILGVKKIPKYKTDMVMPIYKGAVEMIGIGVKGDYWVTKDGKIVSKKEEDAHEGL